MYNAGLLANMSFGSFLENEKRASRILFDLLFCSNNCLNYEWLPVNRESIDFDLNFIDDWHRRFVSHETRVEFPDKLFYRSLTICIRWSFPPCDHFYISMHWIRSKTVNSIIQSNNTIFRPKWEFTENSLPLSLSFFCSYAIELINVNWKYCAFTVNNKVVRFLRYDRCLSMLWSTTLVG
jgi:hypothetical protein